MITRVKCTNCEGYKGLDFQLTIRKSGKFCKKCHNYNEEKINYIYCSYKCMIDHTTQLSTHKCKDHWIYIGGYTFKKEELEKINVMCQICKDYKLLPVKGLFGDLKVTIKDINNWQSNASVSYIRDNIRFHKIKT